MTSQQEKIGHMWGVAEAKAHFSEVIDQVLSQGPQTITRNGKETVVVVSVDRWRRRTRRQNSLADFFAASPLRGSGLEIERVQDGPREIKL
ncbi:MAG: type II toxin-antitoxin system Phd/YefM family antitoxin [Candidatus Dormibacteraceae bacterium]